MDLAEGTTHSEDYELSIIDVEELAILGVTRYQQWRQHLSFGLQESMESTLISSSQVVWPLGVHGPSPDAETTTLWRVGEKMTIPWPKKEVARYHLM